VSGHLNEAVKRASASFTSSAVAGADGTQKSAISNIFAVRSNRCMDFNSHLRGSSLVIIAWIDKLSYSDNDSIEVCNNEKANWAKLAIDTLIDLDRANNVSSKAPANPKEEATPEALDRIYRVLVIKKRSVRFELSI
jgi:hypothetical protein